MSTDVLLTTLFVIVAPFGVHVGAIGSDRWRPRPRGMLKNRVGAFAVRRMNTILLMNGLLLAAAYLAWELLEAPYFAVPLALATPTLILQTMLAGESGRQSTIGRK